MSLVCLNFDSFTIAPACSNVGPSGNVERNKAEALDGSEFTRGVLTEATSTHSVSRALCTCIIVFEAFENGNSAGFPKCEYTRWLNMF
jgi:hypothetical protein